MPDNKLIDNEIIKALEECIELRFDDTEYATVRLDTLTNALDLIDRLQAQNKDLAETTHNLTLEKDALFDKSEELKAEVERLKEFIVETRRCDKEIKSEAIKEFCEKRGIKYVEDDV